VTRREPPGPFMTLENKSIFTPVETACGELIEPGSGPRDEKIPVVVVPNFPALGRLTALRFLEWVQGHPGGVISLPTGKTPEHFISNVRRFLEGWDRPEIRTELTEGGIDPSVKPEMRSLHFVQIDEFYPIDSSQQPG